MSGEFLLWWIHLISFDKKPTNNNESNSFNHRHKHATSFPRPVIPKQPARTDTKPPKYHPNRGVMDNSWPESEKSRLQEECFQAFDNDRLEKDKQVIHGIRGPNYGWFLNLSFAAWVANDTGDGVFPAMVSHEYQPSQKEMLVLGSSFLPIHLRERFLGSSPPDQNQSPVPFGRLSVPSPEDYTNI